MAITAPGAHCDFVSRFFTPQATILEAPVTGSAHCALAPYWAKRLGKNNISALQLSKRIGKLQCTYQDDQVLLHGQAKTYSTGTLKVEEP